MAEGRAACNRVAKDMQPLCRHLLKLARSDIKGKYAYQCQRAGREISKAIRMAEKYPR
jgi:hypothetical protein